VRAGLGDLHARDVNITSDASPLMLLMLLMLLLLLLLLIMMMMISGRSG